VTVDARLDVNVAKSRPSYQASTFTDVYGDSYYAAYGNDGDHNTDVLALSCAHTNSETNPWWAVDLGVPLYVHSVKFTNRDASGAHAIFYVDLICEMAIYIGYNTVWSELCECEQTHSRQCCNLRIS